MKFKEYSLGDLVTIKYGKNQKKVLSDTGTVPIYGTGGLMGYATESLYDKPSVLIGRKGTIGKVKYVDHPFWTVDTLFYTIINTDIVLPKYLYYVMLLIDLNNYNEGTTIPSLRTETLNRLVLNIPSIEDQEKVLSYIVPIDEKIELNGRINKNLEQQALALFRQYFVDFAPYGGFAPSDWTEVSLDDVCTRITDGSHYSPADAPESPYPMYSVKDMETYGFNSSSCKHITEEDFRKMQKGDCVPLLNDILVAKDGSYLKEIFICSEEKDEAILSSIAIFRPDTNIIMPEILLYLLKQPSVRKDVGDNYVSGSALPRIVLKDFKKYRFMLPPMDEQAKIGSVLHSIRMQTKANVDEIQRLSSLRDTLLPRLMSGELDVSSLDL